MGGAAVFRNPTTKLHLFPLWVIAISVMATLGVSGCIVQKVITPTPSPTSTLPPLPSSPSPDFIVENHPLPLEDAHATLTCKDCHPGGIFEETPDTCAACHTDPHNRAYGDACDQCHTTITFQDVAFDHAGMTICQNCHLEDVPPNHTSEACSICHESTETWEAIRFSHDFPTIHGGAAGNCVQCHIEESYGTYTCYQCHEEANITSGHQERDITGIINCVHCHPTGQKPNDN